MRIFLRLLLVGGLVLTGAAGAAAQYSLVVTPGVNIPLGSNGGSVGMSRDMAIDGSASIYREPNGRSLVYGGTVGVQRYLSESIASEPDFSYELLAVPVTAGVRYYLLAGAFRPFLGADGGLNFLRYWVTEGGARNDISNTGLTAGVGAGFRLKIVGRLGIDASVRYQYTLHSHVGEGSRAQLSSSAFSSYGAVGGLSYTFDLQ